MIAAVAIQNVELADRLQLVLLQPHGKHAGDAGVKARTQQRHQALFLEPVVIGPLPAVFELRLVLGFIVRGIEVIDARRQTGIHDRQILIRQRQIDDQLGRNLFDQASERRNFLGVDFIGLDRLAGALLDRSGDRIALCLGPAGEVNLAENPGIHRHLVHADRAYPARADHQNLAHCSNLLAAELRAYRIVS